MQRFTQLFIELDETNRTNDKVAALQRYFASAPPVDAVWGLAFLMGNRQQRAISSSKLRDWAVSETGLPTWLGCSTSGFSFVSRWSTWSCRH